MNRYLRPGLLAGLVAFLSAGCADFLTGDEELTKSPNNPSEASIDQLFVAVQTGTFFVQTSELARTTAMWVQQMAGTDRQGKEIGVYDHDEETLDDTWNLMFAGSGLSALSQLKDAAEAQNDQVYIGVAQVLEALLVGTAASVWGDIPYSETVNPEITSPALDPQQEVYAAVQTLLDDAISNLESGQGDGPGAFDRNYGGDPDAWVELAYTLKARFHMHTAEQLGNAAYQAALAAAQQGISDASGDYVAYFTGAPGEENPWYQFMVVQRAGYISAGAYLVDLLKTKSPDNLLPEYFQPGSTAEGEYIGAEPGEQLTGDFATLSETRVAADFDQPIVTWAENQLIIAEAAYKLNQTALALTTLLEVQAALGLPLTPAVAGQQLLQEIMLTKYIALFQNVEVWNDYKRTCIPALVPAPGSTAVPGRFYYGITERNANENVPLPSAQPERNWNDPNPCP